MNSKAAKMFLISKPYSIIVSKSFAELGRWSEKKKIKRNNKTGDEEEEKVVKRMKRLRISNIERHVEISHSVL